MAVVFPHGYWTPLSTVQDREVKNLKCFIIPPFTLLDCPFPECTRIFLRIVVTIPGRPCPQSSAYNIVAH